MVQNGIAKVYSSQIVFIVPNDEVRMKEQRERENPPPTARITVDGRFTTAVRRNDHCIFNTNMFAITRESYSWNLALAIATFHFLLPILI